MHILKERIYSFREIVCVTIILDITLVSKLVSYESEMT